jgi:hypothetical protein
MNERASSHLHFTFRKYNSAYLLIRKRGRNIFFLRLSLWQAEAEGTAEFRKPKWWIVKEASSCMYFTSVVSGSWSRVVQSLPHHSLPLPEQLFQITIFQSHSQPNTPTQRWRHSNLTRFSLSYSHLHKISLLLVYGNTSFIFPAPYYKYLAFWSIIWVWAQAWEKAKEKVEPFDFEFFSFSLGLNSRDTPTYIHTNLYMYLYHTYKYFYSGMERCYRSV